MHVCLDVGYESDHALAACVAFQQWDDSSPTQELTLRVTNVRDYISGQFYERELPCLLAVLGRLNCVPETIVVDGHVRLDDAGCAGLGMHLFLELHRTTPVIGVAKSSFTGLTNAVTITRGTSSRPLFITAAGMSDQAAADRILQMHGPCRIPTMLSLVDQLSRGRQGNTD